MSIEVRHVSKRFGSVQVLRDVSLTVASGELVALLGPSGSGKTTLLRLISGLEIADAGDILLDGQDTRGQSPRERRAGFVFQHYALFRHMTVFENVAFGLRVRPRGQRLPEAAVRERVGRLLELVHIGSLAQRYPSQLSGGQRQRVALARALAVEPKVLLLDEPFGALEARVRQELRRWLRHLQADLNVTTVLVTHDQEEALEVADRVVVMNEGRIEQVGTPEEVYEHPANPFVYRFMGDVNLFHGRMEGGVAAVGHVLGRAEQGADDALTTRQPDDRALSEATESEQALVGYVRPHDIDLSREPGDPAAVSTMIETVQLVGPAVRLLCRRLDNGAVIEVHLTTRAYREAGLQIGDTAYASPHRMRLYA